MHYLSEIGTKYLTLIYSTSMRLNVADINECIEGTSDCSADAVCNNIKGSYNCTCKPGYSGDGRTCEGKSDQSCYSNRRTRE